MQMYAHGGGAVNNIMESGQRAAAVMFAWLKSVPSVFASLQLGRRDGRIRSRRSHRDLTLVSLLALAHLKVQQKQSH